MVGNSVDPMGMRHRLCPGVQELDRPKGPGLKYRAVLVYKLRSNCIAIATPLRCVFVSQLG